VCNILLAGYLFGDEWWTRWNSLGVFSDDVDHMSNCFKIASDIIKTAAPNFENWTYYVENNCLSGYRSLPFPGFNLKKEVEALANNNYVHKWSEDRVAFKQQVRKSLFRLPRKWNTRMTFLEYIKSKLWITAGSSSIGHYEIMLDDKKIRIKCRKNMVIDVYTDEELYKLCMASDSQTNFVLIKQELGKVRLAVSSDFFTYLKMAYKYYCSSNFDKNVESIVSGESPNEQINRHREFLQYCKSYYGMPFDFASFDHQPKTYELQDIDDVISEIGRLNVDPDNLPEYDRICSSIHDSFDNSELIAREGLVVDEKGPSPEIVLAVINNLMSGLGLTAVYGSCWNKVVSDIAENKVKLKEQTGITGIKSWKKGDDTSMFAKSVSALKAMYEVYCEMNIDSSPGKFSIMYGKNEFLRTFFDDEGLWLSSTRVTRYYATKTLE